MEKQSRRTFLRNSAAAVGSFGLVSASADSALAGSQSEDIPAYTDWIDNEILVDFNEGNMGVLSADVKTALEVVQYIQELSEGNALGFGLDVELGYNFPRLAYPSTTALMFVDTWRVFQQFGIAEEILGDQDISITDDESAYHLETNLTSVPADRQLYYGDQTVFLGSFDPEEIAAKVEQSDRVERAGDGVYVGDLAITPMAVQTYLTWSDDYLIAAGGSQVPELIEATGNGERDRRHEVNDEFARLLSNGGNRDIVTVVQTLVDRPFSYSDSDTSIEEETHVHGSVTGNDIDMEGETIDAIASLSDPRGGIDEDDIATIGEDADERREEHEEFFASVSVTYSGDDWFFGLNPADYGQGRSSPTPTPTPTETPASTPTPTPARTPTATPSSPTPEEQTPTPVPDGDDETNSDDGFGPGFGLFTAASGLGGASYLLRRKLIERND